MMISVMEPWSRLLLHVMLNVVKACQHTIMCQLTVTGLLGRDRGHGSTRQQAHLQPSALGALSRHAAEYLSMTVHCVLV